MWKLGLLLPVLLFSGCGYKVVEWSSDRYATLAVRPIETNPNTRHLSTRMRDALLERCLAGSSLQPTDSAGDLVLNTKLNAYTESIIATGIDGRTERIQFTLNATFRMTDGQGQVLWELKNYQYSDQYALFTGQEEYREEAVFETDKAMRTIADLVITNISLAISELESAGE